MKRFIILSLFFCLAGSSVLAADNSTVFYKEGVSLVKTGDLAGAEKSFKKAVDVSPDYCLGYYGLGRVYLMEKGRVKDAIKCLRRSVTLDGNFARGWFYLGLAEFFSGRLKDSIHSFKAAHDKDRRFTESYYNIGVIYDQMGDGYRAFYYYHLYLVEAKGDQKSASGAF